VSDDRGDSGKVPGAGGAAGRDPGHAARPGPGSAANPAAKPDSGSGPGGSDPGSTTRGGRVSGSELARQALEQAKADARKRGALPGESGGRTRGGRRGDRGGRPGGGSRGAGSGRGGDPARFGAVINALLAERGWEHRVAVGGVFGRWPEIVGKELAEHTKPIEYDDGELIVAADSPAWATQLRLLASTLVRRLNEELGDGSVRRVKVRGPAGPRRPSGAWRVR
jgi:predicted nucleic acid-binding Zn ribbon protein